MADLYLKRLETERKSLWATCRLKGLAKGHARAPTHCRARPPDRGAQGQETHAGASAK